MESICMICNPAANGGEAGKTIQYAVDYLKKQGAQLTIYQTEGPGQATDLAKKAIKDGFSLIVCAGGDGTLRDVAAAVAHTDATLGLIPCGTGNDFVKAMKIPTDPIQAAEVLLHGEDRKIDLGMANEHMFFNVAGIGFDVDVLDYTDEFKAKGKRGSSAYMRGLIKGLFRMKQRQATIRFEKDTIEKKILLVAAGNGRFFGGGMEITPNADLSDGLLDICIIHDIDLWGVITVLPKFLKGKHLGAKRYVTYRKEKYCSIVCEPASRLELDGERMQGTPVEIRVIEKALKIRVPRFVG